MKKKIIIIVLLVMTICGCQKDYKKYSFTDINWTRNNTEYIVDVIYSTDIGDYERG